MKYEVITDALGYVQIIRQTGTRRDFVELDLDQYDLSGYRIYAYKLGKNELIWDQQRYDQIIAQNQRKADDKEINELQKRLDDTDYIIARAFEEVLALTNPLTFVTDVLAIMLKYSKMYRETLALRKVWRARIEELR